MLFLGEETLLLLGAFSRLGYFNFWWAFAFAVAGAIVGDHLWYKIGCRYGEKMIAKCGRCLCISPGRFQRLKEMIKKKGAGFIVFSKFMYGLNHLSLLAAGAIEFDFKKFKRVQFITSFVWALFFMSLGFFFAHSLDSVKHDMKLVPSVFCCFFAVFILFEKIAGLIVRRILRLSNGNDGH